MRNLTNMTDVDNFWLLQLWRFVRNVQLTCVQQLTVFTGQADGITAVLVNQINNIFIHQAAKNHLYHVHGFAGGHTHAINEAAFNVELFEQVANLRAATVHNNRVNTDQLQHHHVAGKAVLQLFVDHGVTAVFNDNSFANKALQIRQSFAQNVGGIHGAVSRQRHWLAPVNRQTGLFSRRDYTSIHFPVAMIVQNGVCIPGA